MKNLLSAFFILIFFNVSAQNKKIWVYTSQGSEIKGLLIGTTDSCVKISQGKSGEYNTQSNISVISQSYLNIDNIKIHKKNGLIRGMLWGAGVGLLPVLVGSIFGPSTGQGGAYVSIVAVPVGIITGAIIGSTSKKKFLISGDKGRFLSFHKRISN